MSEFADQRGVIRDLMVGRKIDAVTEIRSVQGAVRGNHVHDKTHQWTHVLWGILRVVSDDGDHREDVVLTPGQSWYDPPGQAHAWEARSYCVVVVFTQGPRSGDAYESDTRRLETPLIP